MVLKDFFILVHHLNKDLMYAFFRTIVKCLEGLHPGKRYWGTLSSFQTDGKGGEILM